MHSGQQGGTDRDSVPPAPSFADAARRLGHDLDTEVGRSTARHDYRVWDAIGEVA